MNTIADALAYLNGDLSAAHRMNAMTEAEDTPTLSVSVPADINVEFKILPTIEDDLKEEVEVSDEDDTVVQDPFGLNNASDPRDPQDPLAGDTEDNEARFYTLDDLK